MARARPNNKARSVRIDELTWRKAVHRAAREGETVSAVLQALLRGYAEGYINMPKTVTYYTGVGSAAVSTGEVPGAAP